MNKILDIEIQEEEDLQFTLRLTLQKGDKEIVERVNSVFESEAHREQFLNQLSNWKNLFQGWEFKTDEVILRDLGKSISWPHLILMNGKAISISNLLTNILNSSEEI